MDVIPFSDQASKVQRCRRAADLERQHGHFVAYTFPDPVQGMTFKIKIHYIRCLSRQPLQHKALDMG